MKETNINANPPSTLAAGSGMPIILEDGTEVLYDKRTETTRWVLYRHHVTKEMNVAITQRGKTVSVSAKNLHRLLEVVLPRYESPNDQAEPRPARP